MKITGANSHLQRAVTLLESTLQFNNRLQPAKIIGKRVFAIDRGPTGAAETIVYVDIHDLAIGCVYGHVRQLPDGLFAAVMLQSQRFIAAEIQLMLFRRFDYWMRVRLDYKPLRLTQEDIGRTSRASDFEGAVDLLAAMISSYSTEQGWFDDDHVSGTGIDLDVIDVFPPTFACGSRVTTPPPPPATLRKV